jgi:hypothetical protein
VFWLASLHDLPDFEERARVRERSSKVPPELAAEPSGRT